jgi:hypothetical protein
MSVHTSDTRQIMKLSIATTMGSILIMAGVVLVAIQFAVQMPLRSSSSSSASRPPSQIIDVQRTGVAVTTAYPGIEMIVVGALLVGLGEFINRPK